LEQAAGPDVPALAITAIRDGNGWRLDGEETRISSAGIADLYVVFARTGEAPGAKGLSAFIVEAGRAWFLNAQDDRSDRTASDRQALVRRRENTQAQLLGASGQGFAIAMSTLDVFRSTVGAAALGFARRAMDEAVRHATGRKNCCGALFDLQLRSTASSLDRRRRPTSLSRRSSRTR
jgi:alkylation response protein AidB-like acyl-CoA dehydrogenase